MRIASAHRSDAATGRDEVAAERLMGVPDRSLGALHASTLRRDAKAAGIDVHTASSHPHPLDDVRRVIHREIADREASPRPTRTEPELIHTLAEVDALGRRDHVDLEAHAPEQRRAGATGHAPDGCRSTCLDAPDAVKLGAQRGVTAERDRVGEEAPLLRLRSGDGRRWRGRGRCRILGGGGPGDEGDRDECDTRNQDPRGRSVQPHITPPSSVPVSALASSSRPSLWSNSIS